MEDLRVVFRMMLAREPLGRLRAFMQELEDCDNQSEQYLLFCEEYEIGQWFYDTLVENEVDLAEELDGVIAEVRR